MTWKEFRDALEAWGIQETDVIAGIQLRPSALGVGIRKTAHGVEIVSTGTMFPPAEDLFTRMLPHAPDVCHDG